MTDTPEAIMARAIAKSFGFDPDEPTSAEIQADGGPKFMWETWLPDVQVSIAALHAAGYEIVQGWKPIDDDTPRDGTEIDIWVSGPGSRRIADCRWGKPRKANWGDRYGDDQNLPEQWITRGEFALDRRNGAATHWRPRPAAPEGEG